MDPLHPGDDSSVGFTPAYTTLDARLAWFPIRELEIAVVGQHLLEAEHAEYGPDQIERGIYGKVTWRF
jgi:iron complex outermembrane receptor protein